MCASSGKTALNVGNVRMMLVNVYTKLEMCTQYRKYAHNVGNVHTILGMCTRYWECALNVGNVHSMWEMCTRYLEWTLNVGNVHKTLGVDTRCGKCNAQSGSRNH